MAGAGGSPGQARQALPGGRPGDSRVLGPWPWSCPPVRGQLRSVTVVAGLGSLPCEVLCVGCPAFAARQPGPTHQQEEGTGGVGWGGRAFHGGRPLLAPRERRGARGRVASPSLRAKGEEPPPFPKMTFRFTPEPIRTGADLCAGLGPPQGCRDGGRPPPPLLSLCVVVVSASCPTWACTPQGAPIFHGRPLGLEGWPAVCPSWNPWGGLGRLGLC